jgi:two-component system, NtrC family, nitrogen regulation response regulator NtrX
MSKILIVDDEQSILEILTIVLRDQNYVVDSCLDGFSALKKINETKYDLVLLDIKMPKMDGLEVLDKIMEIDKELVVIMISGHGNFETAVESTKKGAFNYIQKPPDYDELKIMIRNAIEYKKSKDELKKLKSELLDSINITGKSDSIRIVKDLIDKYSNLNLNVLITGESGTGKMLVARQIHLKSNRSEKPFVVINCAGLSEKNADSELFGEFRDGKLVSSGKLSEGQGGVILFDEVSNLTLDVQSKILKVIEENNFTRTGQSGEIKIDVRFLFSTNKNLEQEIEEGRFREDLFHRINVLKINIAPLRERVDDIEELTLYFTKLISKAFGIKKKKWSEESIERLKTFRWPGNVREFKNFVERIIFTIEKEIIAADDFDIPGTRHLQVLEDLMNKNMSLNDFQNESERNFLLKVLNDFKYNIVQAAESLKIQRSHLYKLMTKYKIPTPSKIR